MDDSKYLKIRLNSLHPSVPVPFDIFIKINDRYIHYLRTGDSLGAEKIESFEKKAPDSFFIYASEYDNYKKHVSQQMLSEKLTSREKAILLRESSLALVEELYENPDIEQALNDSK
ncbi:MAG: HD family phosphohydrolase, partial [Bdellovibrionales bacterium]|nr:HD family phosphohydrolase [Bdellovibrionales bacterium]